MVIGSGISGVRMHEGVPTWRFTQDKGMTRNRVMHAHAFCDEGGNTKHKHDIHISIAHAAARAAQHE
jgi:hypothetical protein